MLVCPCDPKMDGQTQANLSPREPSDNCKNELSKTCENEPKLTLKGIFYPKTKKSNTKCVRRKGKKSRVSMLSTTYKSK